MSRYTFNKLYLAFNTRSVENDFKGEYSLEILNQVRWAVVIGSVLYLLFGLIDLYIFRGNSLLITYMFVVRVTILGVGLCIAVYLFKAQETLLKNVDLLFYISFLVVLVATVATFILNLLSNEFWLDNANPIADVYYPHFTVIIIYGQIAMRILFRHTLILFGLILGFLLVYPGLEEANYLRLSFKALIITSMIVGAYGNYWIEYYARERYKREIRLRDGIITRRREQSFSGINKECRSFSEKLIDEIDRGLSHNPLRLNVTVLAKNMAMSRRNLEIKVKKCFPDKSPKKCIEERRLLHALDDYERCNDTEEVAYRWGFESDYKLEILRKSIIERVGYLEAEMN